MQFSVLVKFNCLNNLAVELEIEYILMLRLRDHLVKTLLELEL